MRLRPYALFLFAALLQGQGAEEPTVRRIQVEPQVQLEVVDWGGSGGPVICLAGMGNTAHVFDSLARKLTPNAHVYGVTRRGFGDSSKPATGFNVDRLADDVLAIMDALRIQKPVLVGHSIAGQELTPIANRAPQKVAGLVYLDTDSYALITRIPGDLLVLLGEARKQLDNFAEGVFSRNGLSDEEKRRLRERDLPDLIRTLTDAQNAPKRTPPPPRPEDKMKPADGQLDTITGQQEWNLQTTGVRFPLVELEAVNAIGADGKLRSKADPKAIRHILSGVRRWDTIPVPSVALFAFPLHHGPESMKDPELVATLDARNGPTREEVIQRLSREPNVKVVKLPRASHYLFLTHEAEVVREIKSFVATLP